MDLLNDIRLYNSFYLKKYLSHVNRTQYEEKENTQNNLFTEKTHSQLHRLILQDYVLRNGEEKIMNILENGELFEGLMEKYEKLIEALNDEEHFNAFTLMGFEITRGSLISFVIFILSFALTFYDFTR